ncbi:MAG: pirin family protein [Bacteroidia bacterium]
MNEKLPRRNFVNKLSIGITSLLALPLAGAVKSFKKTIEPEDMKNPIKNIKPLGFQWDTADPFLFCVHHEDYFPKGNDVMGPDKSYLSGRHIGDDFIIKDGFRMYHGKTVPGFPGHPHRGFETITVVRKGLVDHADSLGAAGRYGNGDVQWMTAGKGVQHSEMFPLLHKDKENTMELFQIWLNLPKKNKMVDAHFKMLWSDGIPRFTNEDKTMEIEVIAGKLGDKIAQTPPPDSWAADPANEVAVCNIKMKPNTKWTLPKASAGINRNLYFYEGDSLKVADQTVTNYCAVEVEADMDITIESQTDDVSILVLQGKPIGEPVMQYGPFVMNTKEEINQAFEDYHKTQFGGWPWPKYDQVHDRNKGRFAKHSDGRLEEKG